MSPHRITRFWIGLGRRPRVPRGELLERLRRGAFSDGVDIGVDGLYAWGRLHNTNSPAGRCAPERQRRGERTDGRAAGN